MLVVVVVVVVAVVWLEHRSSRCGGRISVLMQRNNHTELRLAIWLPLLTS